MEDRRHAPSTLGVNRKGEERGESINIGVRFNLGALGPFAFWAFSRATWLAAFFGWRATEIPARGSSRRACEYREAGFGSHRTRAARSDRHGGGGNNDGHHITTGSSDIESYQFVETWR
jgi:hypothetical protein